MPKGVGPTYPEPTQDSQTVTTGGAGSTQLPPGGRPPQAWGGDGSAHRRRSNGSLDAGRHGPWRALLQAGSGGRAGQRSRASCRTRVPAERHRALLEQLLDEYDGWAIATTPDAVAAVYPPLPYASKVMAWVRPNAQPTGNRIRSSWEAVIVYPPMGRRARTGAQQSIPDVLVASAPGGFAGAKPPTWTRWVLDALGYNQHTDTVDDLFPGSGAITAAVAQGVLL